jgi:Pyridoxamine 5''-phosphate oxidase.
MNYLEVFYEIMENARTIAVATCVDNTPNVRIMDFVYDKDLNIVYVASFKKNPKISEFNANNKVSITTLPYENQKHLRSIGATIKKSDLTIFDKADDFIKRNPGFKETMEMAVMLDVYEITTSEFTITPDIQHTNTIKL